MYVRPRAMRAATWSETWSERVRCVVDDGRGHARAAHGGRQQMHTEVMVRARDGARGDDVAEVGALAGSVRVKQAASMGMFWLQRDAPAACVAPCLELEEDANQQQQDQLDGEQGADGNDPRQKPAAAECRPTLSMRTASSTALQRCTHADAGTKDARAGEQARRERACGAAGGAHASASRIDQPESSASQSCQGEKLIPTLHDQQQRQGNRESSSTRSTFAARVGAGGGERRERMAVAARIGVAMGEMQVGRRAVGLLYE